MRERRVLIFGKQGCVKCTSTKNKVGHCLAKWGLEETVKLDFLDMASVDGMSEGAFRDVWEIPTTIVEGTEDVIARWDGEVPRSEWLRSSLVG